MTAVPEVPLVSLVSVAVSVKYYGDSSAYSASSVHGVLAVSVGGVCIAVSVGCFDDSSACCISEMLW